MALAMGATARVIRVKRARRTRGRLSRPGTVDGRSRDPSARVRSGRRGGGLPSPTTAAACRVERAPPASAPALRADAAATCPARGPPPLRRPLAHDRETVRDERRLVPTPHPGDWMIDPAAALL